MVGTDSVVTWDGAIVKFREGHTRKGCTWEGPGMECVKKLAVTLGQRAVCLHDFLSVYGICDGN